MSSKRIAFTPADRRAMLDRAGAMKEEDIDLTDPDALPLGPEKWAKGKQFHEAFRPIKKAISLRLDSDVLLWLQSQDGPYQTRINNLLREAMEKRYTKTPSRSK